MGLMEKIDYNDMNQIKKGWGEGKSVATVMKSTALLKQDWEE